MKTYVLTVSRYFPTTHKRKGDEIGFVEKILLSVGCPDCDEKQDLTGENISKCNSCLRHAIVDKKLHTIRANYELWVKRIKEVQEEKAVLKICYWELNGGRFKKGNRLVEIYQLDKDSGCGVQRLIFGHDRDKVESIKFPIIGNGHWPIIEDIAKNDGLSFEDFKEWFRKYDLSKPMAIIHFTSFRY